jgi:hypothetical protein
MVWAWREVLETAIRAAARLAVNRRLASWQVGLAFRSAS